MKILITGASGQLGYHLQQIFSDHELFLADVSNLDIINASAVAKVFEQFKPDVVIHGAAFTAVDPAEDDPGKAFAVNRDGTANLAEHCRAANIPILIISTDYVFDGKRKRPYDEQAKPKPLSVYGASKLAGEQVVRERCPKHWIVRSAWLYGGGQRHRNFVRTMLELARKQSTLKVVNDQVGSPTYAKDLAQAIRQLIDKKLPYGTWHLANSGSVSWFQFAKEILRLTGMKNQLKPIASAKLKRKALRPGYSVLSSAKAAAQGITMRPWEEALADFLARDSTSS